VVQKLPAGHVSLDGLVTIDDGWSAARTGLLHMRSMAGHSDGYTIGGFQRFGSYIPPRTGDVWTLDAHVERVTFVSEKTK